MRLRKEVISLVLAGSLVLGGVSYLPNADVTGSVASAADTKEVKLDDLDCTAWWAAFTDGANAQELSEKEITFSFKSTSYASATGNYECPVAVLYSSNDAKVQHAGTAGYEEYWVVRGDVFGWLKHGEIDTDPAHAAALANAGITYEVKNEFPATWMDDIKAGVDCSGSVKLEGGKAVLTWTVDGVTSVSTVPVSADKKVYIALTGEHCKLTDITFNVPVEDAAPEETVEPSTEPAVSIEPTVTDNPNDPVATLTNLDDLDVSTFWGAHTVGQKVNSKELFFGFKSTTYSTAMDAWNCPVAVLYSSSDGVVASAGTPGYDEYWVVRGDAYGWIGDTNTNLPDALAAANIDFVTDNLPADDTAWGAWKTENRAGVRCEGSVQLVNGKAVLKLTVNGVTSVSSVPVPAGSDIYLAFTGDKCKLSHIKFSGNQEEAKLTEDELNETSGTTQLKSMSFTDVTAKAGAKKITGSLSVAGATVKVKVGNAAAKAATVSGTNFTFSTAALKAGTKIVVTAEREGFKTATTTVTVKGNAKKTIKVSNVKAKKGAKKITATLSVSKATVKVKIGSKKFQKATVKGKKVTFKTTALKKGTKVTIKITKSGYTALTKKVTVK